MLLKHSVFVGEGARPTHPCRANPPGPCRVVRLHMVATLADGTTHSQLQVRIRDLLSWNRMHSTE